MAHVKREAPQDPHIRPVVTGIGPVSSSGLGRDRLEKALSGASAEPAPLYEPRSEGFPVEPFPLHRTDLEAVEALLGEEGARNLPQDPELRLALGAAKLALRDAGLPEKALDSEGRDNSALVVTYEAPGMDLLLRGLFQDFAAHLDRNAEETDGAHEDLFQRFYQVHKQATYSTHSFLHLHVLARELGIHGHTLFLNNACASGLYALEAAASLVREGKAPRVLVLGAESPRFPTKHMWFSELGLYSSDGRLRPFDAQRTGLVLGEGAAALVLEPLAEAQARGAPIYGEYLGGCFNQEAWKITVPNFAEPYYEKAILGACEVAGVGPRDIDVVFTHGAGTGLSDAYEAKGMTSVFGEWPEHPPLVALKGYFGHTLGACSLLELSAMAVSLQTGIIPSSVGFNEPDPKLKLRLTTETLKRQVNTALKLANGFAGFNAAVVLGRP